MKSKDDDFLKDPAKNLEERVGEPFLNDKVARERNRGSDLREARKDTLHRIVRRLNSRYAGIYAKRCEDYEKFCLKYPNEFLANYDGRELDLSYDDWRAQQSAIEPELLDKKVLEKELEVNRQNITQYRAATEAVTDLKTALKKAAICVDTAERRLHTEESRSDADITHFYNEMKTRQLTDLYQNIDKVEAGYAQLLALEFGREATEGPATYRRRIHRLATRPIMPKDMASESIWSRPETSEKLLFQKSECTQKKGMEECSIIPAENYGKSEGLMNESFFRFYE
jgi:hypothetical protein